MAKENIKNKKLSKSDHFVKILSFRVVPAYMGQLDKTAKNRGMTVSRLIRLYIKEGLKNDRELNTTSGVKLRT